jgi:hypothetical protein
MKTPGHVRDHAGVPILDWTVRVNGKAINVDPKTNSMPEFLVSNNGWCTSSIISLKASRVLIFESRSDCIKVSSDQWDDEGGEKDANEGALLLKGEIAILEEKERAKQSH